MGFRMDTFHVSLQVLRFVFVRTPTCVGSRLVQRHERSHGRSDRTARWWLVIGSMPRLHSTSRMTKANEYVKIPLGVLYFVHYSTAVVSWSVRPLREYLAFRPSCPRDAPVPQLPRQPVETLEATIPREGPTPVARNVMPERAVAASGTRRDGRRMIAGSATAPGEVLREGVEERVAGEARPLRRGPRSRTSGSCRSWARGIFRRS